MNDVVAVIVTYNRIELLKKCVEALRNQTYPCDILIIDNASTDGTDSWISGITDCPELKYINTGSNLGGAGGFHFGIECAAKAGYEFIWIMDDDTIPKNDALNEFVKADKLLSGKYGWLSSKCLWTDGSICTMNIQRKSPYKKITNFTEDIVDAQMASFVSLFLKSSVIQRYGLPIKEFFIWTDDWEYTRRISLKEKCYVVNKSLVTHAMKLNKKCNIATDSWDRIERYKYLYRNDVYLYRREGTFGWIWIIAKDCWHTLQTVKTGEFRRIPIIWKGFYAGIKFSGKAFNRSDNFE